MQHLSQILDGHVLFDMYIDISQQGRQFFDNGYILVCNLVQFQIHNVTRHQLCQFTLCHHMGINFTGVGIGKHTFEDLLNEFWLRRVNKMGKPEDLK